MTTYKTNEISRLTGVHPNTVRLYEEAGFITPPKRLSNGYRVFTELQLRQMELARLAMRAEVLQNGLRKKAIEIICLCAALDFDRALQSAGEYEAMIMQEAKSAKAAISSVEAILSRKNMPDETLLKRHDAAEMLNVTIDTLRNWELNGLITIKRRQNGYRVYDASDLERLNIIRALRCANYSLSSILRLMNHLDKNASAPVEEILNTPTENEDIVSVCDRLLVSLEATRKDAARIREMIKSIRKDFITLQ